MNKLIFTLNILILLSILPTHSMEITSQIDEQNDYFLPEDKLVFTCCQIQEIYPITKTTGLQTLQYTIKNLVTMRSTCKKYYKLLTHEKIGNSLENCRYFTKYDFIHDLSKSLTRRTWYIASFNPTYTWETSYPYSRDRMLILIHSFINEKNNHLLLSYFDLWIKKALGENDTCMIEALFKNQILDPTVKIDKIPLFFFASTVKMAQIFIKYGVNIHANLDKNPTYNVLTHIKDHRYPLELTEFYLDKGVKKLELQ